MAGIYKTLAYISVTVIIWFVHGNR